MTPALIQPGTLLASLEEEAVSAAVCLSHRPRERLPRAACIAVASLQGRWVTITFTEETIMQTFRAGFALPFEELRDELDRLWTSLTAAPPLHGWGTEPKAGVFPAVNMRERDDAIVVEAELPGLDVSDIDIAVTTDELVFKGTRPDATADGGGEAAERAAWLRRERGTGSFERRLPLPMAVDAARVEASLVDGVLTITCPKAPESQPHKVRVRTG